MDHTGVAIAQGSVHFPGPGHSGSKVHHVGAVPDGACISLGIWVPPPAFRSFLGKPSRRRWGESDIAPVDLGGGAEQRA